MKTELIIANKSSGQMWEVSNSTSEITLETNRTGSPGTLKFTVIKPDVCRGGQVLFTQDDAGWTASCNFTVGYLLR